MQSTASELAVTTDSATRVSIDAAVAALGSDYHVWAACTRELILSGAPLPCRTAGAPQRCIDGARPCGTAEQNTFEPFVELDFNDYEVPFGGRAYLFEVEFHLPANEEYGSLLFHPPDIYGGDTQANRGWRLTAYDDHHHELPVQCQDWNLGSSNTEHVEGLTRVQHACLPATASDQDYEELSRARYLRVQLVGEFRQLWVDAINVYFRAIVQPFVLPDGNITYTFTEAPSPPPPQLSPSPSPPHPTDPPSPPPARAYTFYQNVAPPPWQDRIITEEPCGVTKERCALLADAVQAAAFVLSASGCCYPLDGPILVSEAVAYEWGDSGTGVFA